MLYEVITAAGLVTRVWDAAGRETLRVTEAGIGRLADSRNNFV